MINIIDEIVEEINEIFLIKFIIKKQNNNIVK